MDSILTLLIDLAGFAQFAAGFCDYIFDIIFHRRYILPWNLRLHGLFGSIRVPGKLRLLSLANIRSLREFFLNRGNTQVRILMVDAQAAAYLSLRLNLFLIVLLKSLVRSRLLLDGRQSIALLLVLWSSQIHHTFTLEFQRFFVEATEQ